ncbi:ABC transporter permease [Nocardioides sp. CFH 31398]|uniref:ABC transporter permease n=1 Tax=Nocardioides sp. CFH 31398 TaxID=2919579 RepID=UPI001F0558C9|nr:ABC transporter permease [Nocardioides sp. CFH 31398]MCH1866431.1 ABC transporter permease [Nocardioides sp. CFH 31398]
MTAVEETPAKGEPYDISHLPLVAPSATTGLFEVFRRRYLLRLLVRREISARYQASFLGILWSYVNPFTQFLLYYFILGIVVGLQDRFQNFAVHVFCGLVVVSFFTETFNAGTRSIVGNKQLVQKLAVPREMFPVASMLVSGYHVIPQLAVLFVVALAYGWTPDPVGMLGLFVALLIVGTLGTALALLFSAANVFFRDFAQAVNVLTNFVRFGVPMIYPYTLVSERFGSFAQFYLLNPIADAVLLVQRAIWVGTTSDPAEFTRMHIPDNILLIGLGAFGGSLVVLVIGQLVFSRLENKIPERL